ncbi:hypothetical protein BN1708_015554 [Verticillium longisporum]|uniref:Uncharacterized protein n=1 Tax=Verticillium longisporum TaxID=100787 RepID=A0A0G4M4Z2_VERLO|nr:hypothetical protein BN1708_015554 [Verticillium longisporum]
MERLQRDLNPMVLRKTAVTSPTLTTPMFILVSDATAAGVPTCTITTSKRTTLILVHTTTTESTSSYGYLMTERKIKSTRVCLSMVNGYVTQRIRCSGRTNTPRLFTTRIGFKLVPFALLMRKMINTRKMSAMTGNLAIWLVGLDFRQQSFGRPWKPIISAVRALLLVAVSRTI